MALGSVSRPAPTLGWVTNKNIGSMQAGEAIVMDNYFPRANTVDLIQGTQVFSSGLGSTPTETLMVWNGGSGSVMLAANGTSIYNVTLGGAVGAALGTGYTNARWQHTNFGNDAGQFLAMVNGDDPYQYYDGTTLTVATLTGTTDTFSHVHAFKGRLFFAVKDQLAFSYLPLGAIQGAVAKFDLRKFARRGGYLMALGTWTRDGGSGLDDFLVALTSKGEVLIYQGSDPSSATDWSLVGVFEVGEPLGRRCMGTYRNDLAIMTYGGFIPLSQVLSLDRQNIAAVAISSNINPTVTSAAQSFGLNFGWQMCVYSKQSMALFNVPISVGGTSDQYVVNTDTGAWCRFTGMNAACWIIFNNDLYYGGNEGLVYKADVGDSFAGSPISGGFDCAYDYLGDSSSNKQFQMIRPTINTSGALNYQYGLDVDFNSSGLFGTGTTTGANVVTLWGSPWGSLWGSSLGLTSKWLSGLRIGRCASFKFRTSTTTQRVVVQSIDWAWQRAGKF